MEERKQAIEDPPVMVPQSKAFVGVFTSAQAYNGCLSLWRKCGVEAQGFSITQTAAQAREATRKKADLTAKHYDDMDPAAVAERQAARRRAEVARQQAQWRHVQKEEEKRELHMLIVSAQDMARIRTQRKVYSSEDARGLRELCQEFPHVARDTLAKLLQYHRGSYLSTLDVIKAVVRSDGGLAFEADFDLYAHDWPTLQEAATIFSRQLARKFGRNAGSGLAAAIYEAATASGGVTSDDETGSSWADISLSADSWSEISETGGGAGVMSVNGSEVLAQGQRREQGDEEETVSLADRSSLGDEWDTMSQTSFGAACGPIVARPERELQPESQSKAQPEEKKEEQEQDEDGEERLPVALVDIFQWDPESPTLVDLADASEDHLAAVTKAGANANDDADSDAASEPIVPPPRFGIGQLETKALESKPTYRAVLMRSASSVPISERWQAPSVRVVAGKLQPLVAGRGAQLMYTAASKEGTSARRRTAAAAARKARWEKAVTTSARNMNDNRYDRAERRKQLEARKAAEAAEEDLLISMTPAEFASHGLADGAYDPLAVYYARKAMTHGFAANVQDDERVAAANAEENDMDDDGNEL